MKWYNYLGCPTVKPRPLKISSGNAPDIGPMTRKDIIGCIIGLIIFGGICFMVVVVMIEALQ